MHAEEGITACPVSISGCTAGICYSNYVLQAPHAYGTIAVPAQQDIGTAGICDECMSKCTYRYVDVRM